MRLVMRDTRLTVSSPKYFYCAECEEKVKLMLYFRTWCPCKESQCVATFDNIEYLGCAVSVEDWEKQYEVDSRTSILSEL